MSLNINESPGLVPGIVRFHRYCQASKHILLTIRCLGTPSESAPYREHGAKEQENLRLSGASPEDLRGKGQFWVGGSLKIPGVRPIITKLGWNI